MQGYQSKESPQLCAVVNATTKVTIPGREDPVIFEVNHATLIEDDNELESLVVPFAMMKHGIHLDMIPRKYGGSNSIVVDGEKLEYEFDDEKIFWKITKPTQNDLDTLKWVELNPPTMLGEQRVRRKTKSEMETQIPWIEWRKHLAMLPEDIVKRTVLNTITQVHLHIKNEH